MQRRLLESAGRAKIRGVVAGVDLNAVLPKCLRGGFRSSITTGAIGQGSGAGHPEKRLTPSPISSCCSPAES